MFVRERVVGVNEGRWGNVCSQEWGASAALSGREREEAAGAAVGAAKTSTLSIAGGGEVRVKEMRSD